MGFDESRQQPVTMLFRELVGRIRCEDRIAARGIQGLSLQLPHHRASPHVEHAIGPVRLRDRPGVSVHPLDARTVCFQRQRRTGAARSAPEIDDPLNSPGCIDGARDLPDHEKVLRGVEERECRALAGAVERAAACQLLSTFDVAR